MINFDIDNVREGAHQVRNIADEIELESQNIQTIYDKVDESWIGAGAQEYKTYLSEMKKKILVRVENLREIAGLLEYAADEAYWADIEAKKLLGNSETGTDVAADAPPPVSSENQTTPSLNEILSNEKILNPFKTILDATSRASKNSHGGKGRSL